MNQLILFHKIAGKFTIIEGEIGLADYPNFRKARYQCYRTFKTNKDIVR